MNIIKYINCKNSISNEINVTNCKKRMINDSFFFNQTKLLAEGEKTFKFNLKKKE